MVLARIFGTISIEDKPFNAFLLGMIYAILGLAIAFTIFRQFAGIVAVFFASMALMPSIHKMLDKAAITGGREKTVRNSGVKMTEFRVKGYKLTLKGMWADHSEITKTYFYSFFGVFLVFSAFTLFMPQEYSLGFFEESTATGDSIAGFESEIPKETLFKGYIINNLWVLAVCFLIALIYGYGATFIITWNAAVWGHAFATKALIASSVMGRVPEIYFSALILTVLPHTATEAIAYFTAAIAGGIISHAAAKEKIKSARFLQVLWQGLIILAIAVMLVFFGAWLETYGIGFFSWLFLG